MKVRMDLSAEELGVLDGLLEREIAGTRVELRRTDDAKYRQRVSHSLEVLEHIHRTVETIEEGIDLTIG